MTKPGCQQLVVFGCSLTKDNFIDTWADLLANKLDVPSLNWADGHQWYVENYIKSKLFDAYSLSI